MNKQSVSVGILGLGSYLPEKVLTNYDLEKMVDTTDEWITRRTGISERRILEKDRPAYELGIEAGKRALADAGITAEEIDLIIVTTETPDYLTPSISCIIQAALGATKAAAFDMNAACSGVVYGLTVAQQFIKTGYYRYVLIIGCEGLSKATDWQDRNTCILFGDAAGAFVVGAVEDGYGIISTHIGADGGQGSVITLPCMHFDPAEVDKRPNENKHTLWMDGSAVLKFAVRIMEQATLNVLEEAQMTVDDLSMIFPHQANIRIVEGALKRLGIENEKVYNILNKYGNISSASIPVSMDEANHEGMIKKGDYMVLVGFGGGLTWGSALIRWSK